MGQLRPQLETFSDEALDHLVRKAELGDLNFEGLVAQIKVIREIATRFDALPEIETDANTTQQAMQRLNELTNLMSSMHDFRLSDPNASSTHSNLTQQIGNIRIAFIRDIRPQLAVPSIDALTAVDRYKEDAAQIHELVNEASQLVNEAHTALESFRGDSATAAASTLSGYYGTQAANHRTSSRWFLGVGITFGTALLVLATVLTFNIHVPRSETATRQWIDLTRDLVARVLFLGVLSYAVTFCARGYRANSHLRYVSEQKKNALDTYGAFLASSTEGDTRDVITAGLVSAVFNQADTGFLDGSNDKTVVESNASSLLAMALRGHS